MKFKDGVQSATESWCLCFMIPDYLLNVDSCFFVPLSLLTKQIILGPSILHDFMNFQLEKNNVDLGIIRIQFRSISAKTTVTGCGNMVPYAWQVTTSLASSKEQGWLFSGVANVKPQLKSLPLYHYHQHNTVMRIMIMMLMIIIMIINLLLTTRCFGKLQNWWRSWKLLLRQFQCIKNYWTCGSSHHLSKHLKSMPNLNWIPPPS